MIVFENFFFLLFSLASQSRNLYLKEGKPFLFMEDINYVGYRNNRFSPYKSLYFSDISKTKKLRNSNDAI